MQEQEIIVNDIDKDEVKKLIDNSTNDNYLSSHDDLITDIFLKTSKKNSANPEIFYDELSTSDEEDRQLDDNKIFNNKDALKSATTKYFVQTGFARSFIDVIRKSFTEIAPINRDTAKYFVTLKGTDNKEKVKECLKYINAVERRRLGIELSKDKKGAEKTNIVNEYFKESRQILDSLIDTFNKEKTIYNLDDEEELYDYFVHTAKSYIIGEFFDYDPEYVSNLKKTDPKVFYNTRQLANIYEYMQSNLSDDMSFVAGVYNTGNDLQMKSRKLINTFDTTSNLLDYSTSTSRDLYTMLEAVAKSNFTGAKTSYFNLDMKAYGIHGFDNSLKYKPLFKNKDVDELVNIITSIDRTEEYNIKTYDNDAYAVTSASMLIDSYINTFQGVDLIKDMFKSSGINSYNDKTNYFLGTIYINDKSLKDIVNDYKKENEELDTRAVASVFLAKAINDPNKAISLVTTKLGDNNVLKQNVVTLEKNYDMLSERCKNHTRWEKFLHVFGVKYNEEKLVKQHNEFKNKFNVEKVQESIMEDFRNSNEKIMEKFNVELTLNNPNELAALSKAKNIEVAELNNENKIDDLEEDILKVSEKVAVKD